LPEHGSTHTPVPLLKGTLDLLVLKALAWRHMHGVEIIAWLEDRSGGTLGVDDGAMYFALHRLEEKEYVVAHWGTTEKGRRARFYKLRPAGRAYLRTAGADLARYARTLTAILGAN
jgi:DNA-binding PadR family transcriptional regulator